MGCANRPPKRPLGRVRWTNNPSARSRPYPEVTDICINGIKAILCDLGLMRTSFLGMNGAMPTKYDENTGARAARLVREHASDYDSEWAAMKANSGWLGMIAETVA